MSAKEGWRVREAINDLLLRALYLVLWFQYRVRALFRLLPLGRRKRTVMGSVPRHIALSGAIANSDVDVAALMRLVVSRGAEHVTLHDPWTTLNGDKIAAQICAEGDTGRTFAVHEVDENGAMGKELRVCDATVEAGQAEDDVTEGQVDVQVTVVRPGAGRGSLVRAVRTLAGKIHGGKELSVAEVTEWLDRSAEGMLPSEPDVVVVFPSKDVGERANVLHGFPVWQLRLTQIRFSTKTIRELDNDSFLEMVTTAAAAPKRFGR